MSSKNNKIDPGHDARPKSKSSLLCGCGGASDKEEAEETEESHENVKAKDDPTPKSIKESDKTTDDKGKKGDKRSVKMSSELKPSHLQQIDEDSQLTQSQTGPPPIHLFAARQSRQAASVAIDQLQ